MFQHKRRTVLKAAASAAIAGFPGHAIAGQPGSQSQLAIASFRMDVTPPVGHGCCGGWIKPVEAVDDTQEAIGFVLLGAGAPMVVCAVDWTGILNSAHVAWRTAIAEAAGTTPDRVAVQCVHQHNAPMACLDAQRLVAEQGDLPNIMMTDFFEQCLDRLRKAVSECLGKAQQVTHIGHGMGRVSEVASNRRIYLNADGQIAAMRGSSCTDQKLRDMTEGLIDPFLRTVTFFNGDRRLVSCHYYACHPMSYYGDGRVTSDFVGLARKRRQEEQPSVTHLYFTGCAGNVAAGKYNDGSKPMRALLAGRIYDGMLLAEASMTRDAVTSAEWMTSDLLPEVRSTLRADLLQASISNRSNPVAGRNRPAYELAWLRRVEQKTPIVLSQLSVNNVRMLHLPAECFIEYQLRAQQFAGDAFVATAAYGDGGPWYVPTKEAYPQGGYEVSVAFCEPAIDDQLSAGIRRLVTG